MIYLNRFYFSLFCTLPLASLKIFIIFNLNDVNIIKFTVTIRFLMDIFIIDSIIFIPHF